MSEKIHVGFKKLNNDATLPIKAHESDSGIDLYANEDVKLYPGETKIINTGLAIVLPNGYEAQVRPRSGLTSKTKLRVQLGTIDQGYTGEIGIIADNVTSRIFASIPRLMKGLMVGDDDFNVTKEIKQNPIIINKGEKIAQLVIQKIPHVEIYELEKLPTTVRGSKGFGSTGK